MTDPPTPPAPRRSWLQFSLGTLLALVLGVCIGLALKAQFGEPPRPSTSLPDPSNIRPGERITIEIDGNVPESKRTALVLADGTISLPLLGQVPAAGLSLEELTADLQQRYLAYYRPVMPGAYVRVFVSFAASSVEN